jgi:hypothetical protein
VTTHKQRQNKQKIEWEEKQDNKQTTD